MLVCDGTVSSFHVGGPGEPFGAKKGGILWDHGVGTFEDCGSGTWPLGLGLGPDPA